MANWVLWKFYAKSLKASDCYRTAGLVTVLSLAVSAITGDVVFKDHMAMLPYSAALCVFSGCVVIGYDLWKLYKTYSAEKPKAE